MVRTRPLDQWRTASFPSTGNKCRASCAVLAPRVSRLAAPYVEFVCPSPAPEPSRSKKGRFGQYMGGGRPSAALSANCLVGLPPPSVADAILPLASALAYPATHIIPCCHTSASSCASTARPPHRLAWCASTAPAGATTSNRSSRGIPSTGVGGSGNSVHSPA